MYVEKFPLHYCCALSLFFVGTIVVRLQPRALEYLVSKLQIVAEIDALRQSSPAEYFRGAFADLDDFLRLQKIQRGLQHAKRIRIQPNVSNLRYPFHLYP